MQVPLIISLTEFSEWINSYINKFKLPVKSITIHPDIYDALESNIRKDRPRGLVQLNYVTYNGLIQIIKGSR